MQAETGTGEGRGVPDAPREALAEDLQQTLPVECEARVGRLAALIADVGTHRHCSRFSMPVRPSD